LSGFASVYKFFCHSFFFFLLFDKFTICLFCSLDGKCLRFANVFCFDFCFEHFSWRPVRGLFGLRFFFFSPSSRSSVPPNTQGPPFTFPRHMDSSLFPDSCFYPRLPALLLVPVFFLFFCLLFFFAGVAKKLIKPPCFPSHAVRATRFF